MAFAASTAPTASTASAASAASAVYPLSPTIVAASCGILAAFLSKWLANAPSHALATISNLSYIFAGLYRDYAYNVDDYSAATLLGLLGGAPFALVFLGAASLAYHSKTVLNIEVHTLDIVGGWLLVLHVFFVAFSVVMMGATQRFLSKPFPRAKGVVRSVLTSLFVLALTLILLYYPTMYSNQSLLFFTLGPSAAVFGGICRLFVVVDDKGKASARALRLAAFELAVGLVVTFAAIICQGELMGRRLVVGTEEYDFFHAHWHYFLALATSLLYTRSADAVQVLEGRQIFAVDMSWLDVFGELTIASYAIVLAVAKETSMTLPHALSACVPFNALLVVHAGWTAWSAWRGRLFSFRFLKAYDFEIAQPYRPRQPYIPLLPSSRSSTRAIP